MATRTTRFDQALTKEKLKPSHVRVCVYDTEAKAIVADVDGTWKGACSAYNAAALGDADKASAFSKRLSVYAQNHEEIRIEQFENGSWKRVNGNTAFTWSQVRRSIGDPACRTT